MNFSAVFLLLAVVADLGFTEEQFSHTFLPNQESLNLCKSSCSFHGFDLKNFSSSVKHLVKCVREEVLRAFDRAQDYRLIQLNEYFSFMKDNDSTNKTFQRSSCRKIRSLDYDKWDAYFDSLSERMERVVKTHSIILRLHPKNEKTGERRSRRRHHYKKAFPMMVAGYMMMSAFLVPLGFQFMAMIGGKALLLSKMAFMMSMYQTYKRYYPEIDFHHFDQGHDVLPYPLHRSSEDTGSGAMTAAYAKPRPDLVYKLKKG